MLRLVRRMQPGRVRVTCPMSEIANGGGMLALRVGSGGELQPTSALMPSVGPGEVLVRVRAAGVNRADLAQVAGHYPPPPGTTDIVGLEVAGEIVELGPGLQAGAVADPQASAPARVALTPGAAVCALLPGGGYAQYAVVPAAMLMPVPAGWTMAQAAAWPEAAFTAFLNLFLEGDLAEGERLLVHGGASGVGTMAIAMAKAAGATVYATAGGAAKVAACLKSGADVAIDRHAGEFLPALTAQGATGVDVILDMVGEDYFAANMKALAVGGRLVIISTLSGAAAQLDLRQLMLKRLRVIGSTLRSRHTSEKVGIKRALWQRFDSVMQAGGLEPVIDQVAPWTEVNALHDRMRKNLNIGKLVLEVS